MPRSNQRINGTNVDLPEHIVVEMPALSPTMEEGTLVNWNVAVGYVFWAQIPPSRFRARWQQFYFIVIFHFSGIFLLLHFLGVVL